MDRPSQKQNTEKYDAASRDRGQFGQGKGLEGVAARRLSSTQRFSFRASQTLERTSYAYSCRVLRLPARLPSSQRPLPLFPLIPSQPPGQPRSPSLLGPRSRPFGRASAASQGDGIRWKRKRGLAGRREGRNRATAPRRRETRRKDSRAAQAARLPLFRAQLDVSVCAVWSAQEPKPAAAHTIFFIGLAGRPARFRTRPPTSDARHRGLISQSSTDQTGWVQRLTTRLPRRATRKRGEYIAQCLRSVSICLGQAWPRRERHTAGCVRVWPCSPFAHPLCA